MALQHPRPLLVRDLRDPHANRQQLARAARRGSEVRVARGAYVPSSLWESLDERRRYLLRIRAVFETRKSRPVASHWSAAAIHDLPILGHWPEKVHVTVPPASGGRSGGLVIAHGVRLSDDDVVLVDGLPVTSVARTVVDLAAVSFMGGALATDRALHIDRRDRSKTPMVTHEELLANWERALPFRGHVRARRVIEFGETKADSPLETVSRVNMMMIGCPRPQLQTRFSDYRGVVGETDFFWPEFGIVGEADGAVKYFDERYRAGRTPEQVLLDEKDRHERLLALKLGVSRWRWGTGADPRRLGKHLVSAGLPLGLPW